MAMHDAKGQSGVTLLEMLVVLLIAAVLSAAAAPSLHDMVAAMRLRSAADIFMAHLSLARSEAIKRNGHGVLCISTDGKLCSTSGSWEQGWIAFYDANGNAQVDADEAVLLQQSALPASVRFTGNTNVARYVSYTPDGGANLVSGGFQAGTFTICTMGSQPADARKITISKSGQTRVVKAQVEACQ